MKKFRFLYSLSFLALLLGMGSCQKDNYDAPKTTFTGHLVYQGKSIQVKNNGNGVSAVYFELWQPGYGKSGAIDVYLNQDGSFSALLFNGEYQLVIPASQGPFVSLENDKSHSDTIPLSLHGNTDMDIEVLPYYTVDKADFTVGADSVVAASASITKVIKDTRAKDIESVHLYVNRTSFVDEDNNIASGSVAGGDIADLSNIKLTAKIPKDISGGNIGVADQGYFYARVGVKITGVDDMMFSEITKVQLK